MTVTTNITDLRHLVKTADLSDLVVAYASGSRHPFAVLTVDGEMRFVCPRCSHVNHNGGTAILLDCWRWSCHWCRHTGTRYQLERLVLEDAVALEALYEQVHQ